MTPLPTAAPAAIEVKKARDISPQSGQLMILAGPPGTGKSTFAGSVAQFVPPEEVLVIATLPREVDSLPYQKYNLDTVVISDTEWRPSEGSLKATGYPTLMRLLRDLRSDTKYSAIILDNGTEAGEMAWHAALEPLGVGDPTALPRGSNRYTPYMSVREKMEQLVSDLSLLTGKTGFAKKPKLVIVPWHIQPPKDSADEGESADERGRGSEYEGEFLPMIRGSYRRRIGGQVSALVYTDLVQVPRDPKNALSAMEQHYCLQLVSDAERHCKIAGTVDASKLVKGKYLDVHGRDDAFKMFMDLLPKQTT